jgi:CBS domain-containing protein
MKISDVLAAKGGRVITVWPSKRVDQLPQLFEDRGISSAVVADATGRPLGIVTDRLFMKAMAQRGPDMLQMTAADIMETPVPACSPDQTVQYAMRRMTDERIRHLVVMQGGKVVGVVSIGDLVKARLQDAEMESKVLRELALGQLSAT